jgi:hypothetical protein
MAFSVNAGYHQGNAAIAQGVGGAGPLIAIVAVWIHDGQGNVKGEDPDEDYRR